LGGGVTIEIVKQRLKQALARRQKRHVTHPTRVSSAVLIPLYKKQGQYYVLFIQRTEKVKDHKGQIGFPGGAYEEQDGTLLNTALREAAEEIGLTPGDVEILGELDDITTRGTNYIISPFVASVPWPYQFEVDQWETEEIIEVPLSALFDKDCLRQETDIFEGQIVDSYFYQYQGKVIWGATARILRQFLDIIASITEYK
jgi:8-oxo-dGTP pyrophosphatase MutT (NUDIX family)